MGPLIVDSSAQVAFLPCVAELIDSSRQARNENKASNVSRQVPLHFR